VKHELFIRVSGTTELPATNSDATTTPRVLYYTRRLKAFLSDPVLWVQNNPAAGYTVTQWQLLFLQHYQPGEKVFAGAEPGRSAVLFPG
jgi:hypothetical protein